MRCSRRRSKPTRASETSRSARINRLLIRDQQFALLRLAQAHLVANLPGVKDGLQRAGRDGIHARRRAGEIQQVAALSADERDQRELRIVERARRADLRRWRRPGSARPGGYRAGAPAARRAVRAAIAAGSGISSSFRPRACAAGALPCSRLSRSSLCAMACSAAAYLRARRVEQLLRLADVESGGSAALTAQFDQIQAVLARSPGSCG